MERIRRFISLMLGIALFLALAACNTTASEPGSDPSEAPEEILADGLVIGKQQNTTIAAGSDFTVGIKTDGTATIFGTYSEVDTDADITIYTL